MKLFKTLFFLSMIAYSFLFCYVDLFMLGDKIFDSSEMAIFNGPHFNTGAYLHIVNAFLPSFFFLATSVLFMICVHCLEQDQKPSREYYFYLSQVWIFGFLGVLYQFMLHKLMARFLMVSPVWIVFVAAFLEFLLLATVSNLGELGEKTRGCIYKVAILFSIVVSMDILSSLQFRLSSPLQEIAQTWASLFLFLFAWNVLSEKIVSLKKQGHSLTNIIVTRRTETEKRVQGVLAE